MWTVQYLHSVVGIPTKATWIKSIQNGNNLTWPLLTIQNVNRNFPESEDTHKGHMRNHRQGVRSTKVKAPNPGNEPPPVEKNAISSSICTEPKGPCKRNQQGSPPTDWAGETNTKWSCVKLISTPPGLKPQRQCRGGYDLGPALRPRTDENLWHSTYTPGTGQWNLWGVHIVNQKDEHELPDRHSRLSPAQHVREGDSDMEGTLHWSDE